MEKEKSDDELRFRPLAGLNKVFEPGKGQRKTEKKHPCSDCHFCQYCADARCHSCRSKDNRLHKPAARKLSLREQIRLYETINAEDEQAER